MTWKTVTLRSISDYLNRWISPKYSDEGNLILNQKCIRRNSVSLAVARYSSLNKKIAPEKFVQLFDILVNSTGTGTLGRTAQVKELSQPTSVDTHITIVRPNNKVDKRFIGLQMSLKEPEIVALGKGATNQQELGRDDLGSIEIQLPSILAQNKIASILSSYDDLIDINLKRIMLLYEIGKIQFDCLVKADIPVKEVDLQDIAFYLGRGVTPRYNEGSGFYAINQKANKGLFLEELHFKEYKVGNWVPNGKYAKNGDVLINSLGEGTIGRCHFYKWGDDIYPVDQHMSIFRGKSKEISLYVYQFLDSEEGQGMLYSLKKGGTNMTMLNISDLRCLKIKMPTAEKLKEYYLKVEPLYSQKAILENQNRLLKKSRDILLPRLMSGKIKVEELNEKELAIAAEPESLYKSR